VTECIIGRLLIRFIDNSVLGSGNYFIGTSSCMSISPTSVDVLHMYCRMHRRTAAASVVDRRHRDRLCATDGGLLRHLYVSVLDKRRRQHAVRARRLAGVLRRVASSPIQSTVSPSTSSCLPVSLRRSGFNRPPSIQRYTPAMFTTTCRDLLSCSRKNSLFKSVGCTLATICRVAQKVSHYQVSSLNRFINRH